MSNPMKDYVANFRANLPSGVTYDSDIGRYFVNNKRFLNEWEVERYLNYITKFGFSAGFDPATLFASGEQGAWYDPSDLTTLYQDSAGTTAVTADGDPVGLMLDKSQGLALGPELVTNGTFDSDTDWTLGNGWTISGGTLSCSGNTQTASQNMGLVAGVTYLVEFEIANRTTGSLRIRTNGTEVFSVPSPNGLVSATIVATAATFEFYSLSGWDGDIDNISVRELPGNHATQPTSAARPVYRTDGTLHWLEFDGVDDNLKVSSITSLAGPVTMAAGFEYPVSSEQEYLMGIETGRLILTSQSNTSGTSGVFDGGSFRNFDTAVNTPYVIVGLMQATGSLRFNGVEQVAFSMTERAVDGRIAVGSRFDSLKSYFSGSLYGLVLHVATTSISDLSNLETYLADKSGVTL